MSVSRRDALKKLLALGAVGATGITGLSKEALALEQEEKAVRVPDPRASYPDTKTVEDLYRGEFSGTYGDPSKHGFAYHCVNCQGNCAWRVWTGPDGKVTRENQSASYPAISSAIPDFNPRGCNKGGQHSQYMYEHDRLKYPMKRTGKRGEGKWKRISWDEAIDEVTKNIYRTLLEKGPAGNYIHIGAGVLTEARAASIKRMGTLLGAVRPYISSYVGDMFPGVSVVYGEGNIGCTYDFLYTTNVAVFWGCNPNTSRIPDAHFVWEGKYNGSKVIVISPEFNSTAIHADLWVPLKPGYDGHLAMSIMHEIVAHKLYKEEFLTEFTDLPFLIRTDTLQMVRLEDIDQKETSFHATAWKTFVDANPKKHPHEAGVFLCHDSLTGKFSPMPGCEGTPLETLRLKDMDYELKPSLEGEWKVRLKDGKTVAVTTAFALFKRRLEEFSPEKTQPLTGVHPHVVRELAQDLSLAKNALVTMGFSIGKHFNGLNSQRAMASLTALTGRLGSTGGLNTENEWNISGISGLSGFSGRYNHRFASGFTSEFVLGDNIEDYEALYADEDVKRATGKSKKQYRKEVEDLLKVSANDEGHKKGMPYWTTLETFLIFADSRFRRNKGRYRDAFLKKAKFLAVGEVRMSDTAMFADVILPCKTAYEVWDLRTNPGYHRYANIAHPPLNLAPVGECKSEWEIATLIVERLEALAKAKYEETKDEKVLRIPDETHTLDGYRALDELVADFTMNGKVRSDKDAVEYTLAHVDQFNGHTISSMYKQGGHLTLNDSAGKSSPLYRDRPYNTFESNQFLKLRFETLSGRLSFYVDHPLWIEAGANLPTATVPMRPKRYPFALLSPHARWSIHSTYKNSTILQRLQRGVPYIMVNPAVAEKKGFKDGDRVRVFNDLGETIFQAKVTAVAPPDSLVMEHGWEPFFYANKTGHNQLVGDMINLLELTEGWGHLKFGTNWDGNQHAYETTIDIEKA